MESFFTIASIFLSGAVALGAELPRSSPEEQGISSAAILAFVETADRDIDSLHSFMLVRHGHVVAEGWWAPYDSETPHALFSLSKSFASTAVGLAVAEGKLSLDDEVLKFFPESAPSEPSENLKAMRVRDLLRMTTGHQTEPARPPDKPWTREFLAHPVPHKPGTHFLYNTSATYMLAAIVEKTTGEKLLEYLRPRLFEPLGIERPTWEVSPEGFTVGGYGLSIRTEDIARFGQLYLQRGRWQGKQLVPEAWIEEATARQTSNGSNPRSDWDQGYGYQFWRCRQGAYRGDGTFGQYCIVLPAEHAVIAITAGLRNMQAVLDLVWEKLLPAMKPAPLPADEESRTKLARKLKSLSIRPLEGSGAPAMVSGKRYVFPPNGGKLEAIALESDCAGGPVTLLARFAGVESRLACPRGAWKKGRVSWRGLPESPVAASGAWTEDGVFSVKLCFCETPFIATVRLKFSGDEVRCESEWNVSFGQPKEPEIVGRAEPRKPLETVGEIERFDPRIERLIPPGATIEKLAEGFDWSEGPLWVPDPTGGHLLFSDVPRNAIYCWKEGAGASVFLKPSGYTGSAPRGGESGSNGLLLDAAGRLVVCQHGDRCVARLENDGTRTVLAERYSGRRLNSPNDGVFNSRGELYFTDPPYGLPKLNDDPWKELDFNGVYLLRSSGELVLLTKEMSFPNGIGLSPDEKTLYVANSDPAKPIWMAFPVRPDGTLEGGRVFFDATELARKRPGLPDGLKVDREGNLFATGPGGVLVLSPQGEHLGTILTGVPTANCAWGEDGSALYITAGAFICRVRLLTKGAVRR